jgi:hypothetical protein
LIDVVEMYDDDGSTWPLVDGDRVTLHDDGCPGLEDCRCKQGPLVVLGPSAFA